MGHLSFQDIKTGVIFGFLKEVLSLKDEFGSDRVVFCFESGLNKRKELFPEYKLKRHSRELDETELQVLGEFKHQLKVLRQDHLPRIGFSNVFTQRGYESDDIIASITQQLPEDQDAIIISSDGDLLQLLRPNVMMYNPGKKKAVTLQSFSKETGLEPWEWAKVKAIGGCKTDEVPGIPGVGEKTAIKYILGKLKPDSAAYKAIKANKEIITRNRKLVELPFEGTQVFELRTDTISDEGWKEVCDALGMSSIRGRAPTLTRTKRANFGL
jgi:5'-3' exonuclease